VRLRTELDDADFGASAGLTSGPPWTREAGEIVLPGSVLGTAGVALPLLRPASGVLVEAIALP
jgi:hypothetical protein